MAACTDSKWQIDLWKLKEGNGNPPVKYDLLVFDLKIGAGGAITGEVSIGIVKLSDVSGMCQPNTTPDGNILTLIFTWAGIDVFLIGFTFEDGITRFRGSFITRKHVGVAAAIDDRLKLVAGPGDGETGTGTGQQT